MIAQSINSSNSDVITQLTSSVVLLIAASIGAIFARRAQRKSQDLQADLSVPDGPGHTRAPGPILATLEREVADASNAARKSADATERIAAKVEVMQMDFAKHLGQHEGLMRDLERLLNRVYREQDEARNGKDQK